MVINRGDICWADYGPSRGSTAAGTRPVVVVQSDRFNRSGISTVVTVPLTTRPGAQGLPGNVVFRRGEANLPRRCTAVAPLVSALDRGQILEKIGTISREKLDAVLDGIELVLGRS